MITPEIVDVGLIENIKIFLYRLTKNDITRDPQRVSTCSVVQMKVKTL